MVAVVVCVVHQLFAKVAEYVFIPVPVHVAGVVMLEAMVPSEDSDTSQLSRKHRCDALHDSVPVHK